MRQRPVHSSPHIHTKHKVELMMRQVIYALIPAVLIQIYYFGLNIIINLICAVCCALLLEFLLGKKQHKRIYLDGSGIVTAVLLALSLSPFTPWWIVIIGIAFAILIAKNLYGGLGHNLFNPAMAGYAFVLLCFPRSMTYWPDFHLEQSWWTLGFLITDFDSVSGATPLSYLSVNPEQMYSEMFSSASYPEAAEKIWRWLNLAYLAGGIYLLAKKVIHWQIPAGVLCGLLMMSTFFYLIDSDSYLGIDAHLFAGATMLTAFFIATEPSSSAASPIGQLIYGFGIGVICYIIRTWGSYPDGFAFSVLIMNGIVPMLDYYTAPKISGTK